ncbi:hypothetical protein CYLTODRAFT_478532 [Cylindrobasidium torrendii FP15055 ss-10]|uniref:Uncharacterized protein n=1 Tax=Cylindrobasidium torrendii FP15055 ss-10 TaxID=1314674 RepID=A0A0D7AUD4_9AGAR|nr:hypothetical protein CYLTODRAFT_478532 [Cylindrobasidium torrendii FP15055 ss-10]
MRTVLVSLPSFQSSTGVSASAQMSSLYYCENDLCKRPFSTLKAMRSHLKQANSCKWWTAHSKQAENKLEKIPGVATIVPGSIHDMTASHFAPDPNDPDEEDNLDGEGDGSASDDDDNESQASRRATREMSEVLSDDDDLVDVQPLPVGNGHWGSRTRAVNFACTTGQTTRRARAVLQQQCRCCL